MGTAIEWTDTVWNPVTGCNKVSEGCRNCYAFALHDMRHKSFTEGKKLPRQYAKPFSEIQLFPERLEQPLKWRKPRRIFVNSMSDLFHEDVPEGFIGSVWDVMARTPRHTYQILTKRPERMQELLSKWADDGWYWRREYGMWCGPLTGPLPNVWLGVSVENQKAADERIPLLLQTPAAVRFLSCEPLLGPVDLEFTAQFEHPDNEGYGVTAIKGIDWVIVGGESGPNARPMHPEWVRGLRDQCEDYGVPFFFKQWGEWMKVPPSRKPWEYGSPEEKVSFVGDARFYRIGKKKAGRLLDGREWNEIPTVPPTSAN
ncbi:DUF5131 family protein [Brevibacillus aydinogluensis]|jgi:protein gp37|uniref:Phage Gp37/Gp68 family protein n=1 Tax=Brevibacillus aydinogluensis TaxID=927786 RepID=A0AA48RDF1_9BACL|nr:phage Gp37/Gp68 family protein [Brevibacillus aydinogluensis]CAJ1003906.1 Phage Gp37/Gp68 family protein [Brevibacillus aydinogluensis]